MAQAEQAASDMHDEYKLMKSHDWKYLDDYYHCKANYNATKRGRIGEATATIAGNYKEGFDYFKNRARGKSYQDSRNDYWNDIKVNEEGRRRARENGDLSAQDACSDYRQRNKSVPKKYW